MIYSSCLSMVYYHRRTAPETGFLSRLKMCEFIRLRLKNGERNSKHMSRTNDAAFTFVRSVTKIANGDTHESEFSLSVSDSSLRCDFHFLYLSIRSIRYEFFFAFLINWNFSSSFAVGLCARTQKKVNDYKSISLLIIASPISNSSDFPISNSSFYFRAFGTCFRTPNSFHQFQLTKVDCRLHDNGQSLAKQRNNRWYTHVFGVLVETSLDELLELFRVIPGQLRRIVFGYQEEDPHGMQLAVGRLSFRELDRRDAEGPNVSLRNERSRRIYLAGRTEC